MIDDIEQQPELAEEAVDLVTSEACEEEEVDEVLPEYAYAGDEDCITPED